jgi:cell pole-organizing protein PopZ
MSSAAKASEPTMEEILASIRRIIADDEPAEESPAPEPASKAPAMKVVETAPEEPAGEMSQDDIDAMLASFDSPALPAEGSAVEAEEPAAQAEPEPEPEPSLDEWGLAEEEENVLELTDPVDAGKSAFDDDVEFRDRVVEETSNESLASGSGTSRDLAASTAEPLLDAEVGRRIAGSFGSLNDMIFAQNARTIEDLIQEMLRPMLKGWLDDNLPQIVERMVRAEIERVSRGRR